MGYLASKLSNDVILDIAVELLSDDWGGTSKLKLRIVDFHFYE
jgi:hypothetical protein